jgi:hypothetical protein
MPFRESDAAKVPLKWPVHMAMQYAQQLHIPLNIRKMSYFDGRHRGTGANVGVIDPEGSRILLILHSALASIRMGLFASGFHGFGRAFDHSG